MLVADDVRYKFHINITIIFSLNIWHGSTSIMRHFYRQWHTNHGIHTDMYSHNYKSWIRITYIYWPPCERLNSPTFGFFFYTIFRSFFLSYQKCFTFSLYSIVIVVCLCIVWVSKRVCGIDVYVYNRNFRKSTRCAQMYSQQKFTVETGV